VEELFGKPDRQAILAKFSRALVEFKITEKIRLRPVVEFDNVLNKTVFSFGSEFIDFTAIGPTSSAATKQAFLDSFLVATRTLRPRQIRLGVRLDF